MIYKTGLAFLLLPSVTFAGLTAMDDSDLAKVHGESGISIDIETEFDQLRFQHEDESDLEVNDASLDLLIENFNVKLTGIDVDVVSLSGVQGALSIGIPRRFEFDDTRLVLGGTSPNVGEVITTGPPTAVDYTLNFDVSNNPFDVFQICVLFCINSSDFDESYSFTLSLSSEQIDNGLYSLNRNTGPADSNASDDVYRWTVNPDGSLGGPDAGSATLSIAKGGFYTLTASVEGCDNSGLSLGINADTCEPSRLDFNLAGGNGLSASGGNDDNDVVVTSFPLGFLGPRDDQWVTYQVRNLEIIDVTLSGQMYGGGHIRVFGL